MGQRISLVTLGVADLGRARAFSEALGWSSASTAEDSGVIDAGGWAGVTIAHNVGFPADVDAVLAEAEAAGATIARPGAAAFWGGYSGVFVDPDGHPWEVAHNPFLTLGPDSGITL